jgi:hypothetical protein
MTNTSRFASSPAVNRAEEVSDLHWPDDPAAIPDWIYTDPRIYEL